MNHFTIFFATLSLIVIAQAMKYKTLTDDESDICCRLQIKACCHEGKKKRDEILSDKEAKAGVGEIGIISKGKRRDEILHDKEAKAGVGEIGIISKGKKRDEILNDKEVKAGVGEIGIISKGKT
ncbi:uncharacterized protein LOC124455488 [Xenia sp. Carnegie-2017]|uniref:uncharacterized protein LOC124455488 n=1 Tax=Xenia sp. Carnegie-2017 TaxID=2897299 RepID=UPI001F043E66|nr:uncharacterized protein LOC124455488 [Xenia sp. Carnegie-2017]